MKVAAVIIKPQNKSKEKGENFDLWRLNSRSLYDGIISVVEKKFVKRPPSIMAEQGYRVSFHHQPKSLVKQVPRSPTNYQPPIPDQGHPE